MTVSLLLSLLVAMLGLLGLKGGIGGRADVKPRASASVMFTGAICTVRLVAIPGSSCTTGVMKSNPSGLE